MQQIIDTLGGNFFYLFAIIAFVAVVLFIEGIYQVWNAYRGPEAQRISKRLQAMSAGGVNASILRQRLAGEMPLIERWLLALPRMQQVDRLILQSGLDWTVGGLTASSVLLGLAVAMGVAFIPAVSPFIAMGAGIVAAGLPLLYLVRKRAKRLRRFEEQLPEALDLISRALKAGHAFPTGLKMVADEMSDPIASEFRLTHDEVNFGVSMQQALMALGTRTPSTDLRYFVIAVLIQRETGGNLTEVLGNLSRLIRERLKLFGKIRVLSAEGRLSGWILSLLPFVLAAVINAINPKFMQVLWTDPAGHKLVLLALVMMVLGIFTMRKIIRIHV